MLASIGGAGSGPVFEGSTSAAHLSTFVDNLAALLAMGYDGIDIDWEGGNLSAQQDQALETSLIQALRAKSPGTLLTFTAGAENENLLDDLTWYGTVAAQLDRINLMTYGMSGAYQGWESWHSSPLHWNSNSSTPTGIDATVKHYLAAGVPAAKLGVGTGFYGECYTTPVTAPVQALGSSTVAASDGTMSYPNIMASYYAASDYHYDSAAEAPYLTLSGSNAQHCTYVSYEDADLDRRQGSVGEGAGARGRHHLGDQRGLRARGGDRAGAEPAAGGDEDGVPAVAGPISVRPRALPERRSTPRRAACSCSPRRRA